MPDHETPDPLRNLAALADPVRRRLYEHVAASDEPVRRDEAAQQVGVGRSLAAYHLDQLVDAGLLAVSYARLPGRTGPGAGRPAKRYQRVPEEVSVSLPPRNYNLLARILIDAIEADNGRVVRSALEAAANHEGLLLGRLGLLPALRRGGFEPVTTDDGGVDLRNCPFGALAADHADIVCGVNLELVRGMLNACGEDPGRARLNPRPTRCCVTVAAAPDPETEE